LFFNLYSLKGKANGGASKYIIIQMNGILCNSVESTLYREAGGCFLFFVKKDIALQGKNYETEKE
jgi:hypothetical protein